MHPNLSLLLLVGAAARAQATCIEWRTCHLNETLPIQCGNLSVPLDYTAPKSTATLRLELVRVPAAKTPSKGSILLNFGGPGGEAQRTLAELAIILQAMSGGYHDLVAFDPRGTGNTLEFACYNTTADRQLASGLAPVMSNASDVALGAQWAAGTIYAEACSAAEKDIGSLLGTTFVARDMMQVVDALGEDGMLRYWGISYGTALGATLAALFPDRMDKVLLDGVLNPQEYFKGFTIEMFTDTDKSWHGILEGCVTTPENCALASKNISADALQEKIYTLIDRIKYHPFPLFGSTLVDYDNLKVLIFNALYAPSTFPALTSAIDGLFSGNLTALTSYATAVLDEDNTIITQDALYGISCGDKITRATHLEDIEPAVSKVMGLSRLAGEVIPFGFIKCAQWKMDAAERYLGDFHVKTRNPVLLIGNTYDPVTPLLSARNVSEGLEGSVVLEQVGFGHSSLAQPSLCTANVIRGYFINGTLPEQGTKCDVDNPIFQPQSWLNVIGSVPDVHARDLDEGADEIASRASAAFLQRISRGFIG